MVVFDNFFANRKSKPGTVFFAKGRESLEQRVRNLWRDTGAPIFDLGNQFIALQPIADEHAAAVRHRIGRVRDQIVEHTAEAFGIDRQ